MLTVHIRTLLSSSATCAIDAGTLPLSAPVSVYQDKERYAYDENVELIKEEEDGRILRCSASRVSVR